MINFSKLQFENLDFCFQILEKSFHDPEVQIAKLVSENMSDVAYQALCNSMISTGDPECDDYKVEYKV